MKLLLMYPFLIFFVMTAQAAQDAVVIIDGSMVYKKADFDASVIGYFRMGQKVRISDKTFGPFYRVSFKQGIVGYIADVDLQLVSGSKGPKKNESVRPDVKKSFIGKRLLGPSLAMVNYSDTINNKSLSDTILMYGLKWNFPFRLFSGPFITDINFLYSNEVPSFYKNISSTPPSATLLFLDANILFSFYETKKREFGLYAGGGPLITYTSISNIDLIVSDQNIDLTESIFGGNLTAGAALRAGSFAFKLEAHYYVLKTQFYGLLGSFQYEF